ncbi:MAG: phosphatidylglycerol lysyltransferase domain-containing protein [Myxococcota bacterium]
MADREDGSDDLTRAHAIVRRHGRASTSFQTLEHGLRYHFDGDGYVAFAEVGRAWVAAGAPVSAPGRAAEVARSFVEAARRAGRRPRFFGVDASLDRQALRHTRIGEEPWWDARRWHETLRAVRSLREQLRRARAKNVRVRLVSSGALDRAALEALAERWLDSRRMAPMGFLVQLDPFRYSEDRLYLVAERDGAWVGLLVAAPVFAGPGWLVEHVLRDPAAPNGTAELLVDALMRQAARTNAPQVCLGHLPLAGRVNRTLRLIRRLGRFLYNFEGLEAFKRKLRPHRMEPIHLAYPARERGVVALIDVLRAFAPGGFLRFGIRTLGHLVRRAWPRRAHARLSRDGRLRSG